MKTKAFSLSGIAFGNLRNRKRQYVLLAIGIALAIYFIATALLFGFGIYTSLDERRLNRYGQQDVMLFDCGDTPLNDLVVDGTLSGIGKAEILAEAVVSHSAESSFAIAKYDDTAIALSRRRLKVGEYPRNTGEIAIEQSALARLRQDAGVGDTITLTLRIPDGNGGFLSDTVEKTYTLTGILYDQLIYWDFFMFDSVYHDIPAGLVSDEEPIEPGGRAVMMAYGVLAQGRASMSKVDNYSNTHSISYTQSSWMLDMGNDVEQEMIFTGGFAVLVGFILVSACCLGIVNAFSANLDARRRQIGLLRAVGATQKQIKQVFGRETLALSLIAIPLGLTLAVLSVFAIFSWLGEEYVLSLNPWVLLGVAALGVMCVMLASRLPLRRASTVPPMQAVRDVDVMRRVQQKKIRSRTAFIASSLIAARSRQIYRRKRAGICAALAAGILVFTLASLFVVTITTQITSYTNENDYTISSDHTYWDTINYGFCQPGLTELDRQEVLTLPLVETVLSEKQVQVKLLPDKITSYATGDGWHARFAYLSPDNPSGLSAFGEGEYDTYLETKNRYYDGSDYLSVFAIAVEESIIKQLDSFVYEGSINIDKLRSGEEVLLIAPKEYEIYFAGDESRTTLSERPGEGLALVTSQMNDTFHAGDTLMISLLYTDAQPEYNAVGEELPEDVVRIDKTVTIGALIDNTKWVYGRLDMRNYPGFLDVITTLPGLAAMGFDVPYNWISIRLSETPDAQTEAYLNDALDKIVARVPDASLSSSLEYARNNRRMAAQAMILSAALSILMFAIVASMMNNALSAHIRAGLRRIGTLRAVGMDSRDIFRSYFYQMFPVFAWGGGIGLFLSLLAGDFVIQHLIQSNVLRNTVPQLPVWQPLVFAALLMGVCAWNIHAKLRGIMRESITENIREL